MENRSNYLEWVPQDIRCVIVSYAFGKQVYFSDCEQWLRMVLHPKSPFAADVGVLFSVICIGRFSMENLLMGSRFFERAGRTVEEVVIRYRDSPDCTLKLSDTVQI